MTTARTTNPHATSAGVNSPRMTGAAADASSIAAVEVLADDALSCRVQAPVANNLPWDSRSPADAGSGWLVDLLRHELGELVCLVELARDVAATATRAGAADGVHHMHRIRTGEPDTGSAVEVVMGRCGTVPVLIAGLTQRYGPAHGTRTNICQVHTWRVGERVVTLSTRPDTWRFLISSAP